MLIDYDLSSRERAGAKHRSIPLDISNVARGVHWLTPLPRLEHPFRVKPFVIDRADAVVSADGDGDRPLVIDHLGRMIGGDVLGIVVADWLMADCVVVPLTVSDALERYTNWRATAPHIVRTKIGSPYVIAAMNEVAGQYRRVVGWEANGGFLIGNDIVIDGAINHSNETKSLPALPTRDAMLPIVVTLVAATSLGTSLSELVDRLPSRVTASDVVDEIERRMSGEVLKRIGSGLDPEIDSALKTLECGAVVDRDTRDGVRLKF